MTSDRKSKVDVISHINQAKTIFNKKVNLFSSNNIEMHLRKHVVKTVLLRVPLYGSEKWTLGDQKNRKVVVFEFWCFWMDKVTNGEVLRRMEEPKPRLYDTLQYRLDSTKI